MYSGKVNNLAALLCRKYLRTISMEALDDGMLNDFDETDTEEIFSYAR